MNLIHHVDYLVCTALIVSGQKREKLQHVDLNEGIGNASHEALGFAVSSDNCAETLHESRNEFSETRDIRWGQMERKEGELNAYPSRLFDTFIPDTSTP